MKTKKRIATLTAREDKTWVSSFNYHKEEGLSDKVADQKAWKETQESHPRLRKYAGCNP